MSTRYQDVFHSVATYGAVGDGQTNDASAVLKTIEAALRENPENTVYFPNGLYRIAEPILFPDTLDIVFEDEATLLIDADVTVEWYSHLEAGLHPIFTGKGLVKGHLNNPQAYPQWYGAAGDGQNDDTEAFQRALKNTGALAVPYTEKGYVLRQIILSEMKRIYGCDEQHSRLIATADCQQLFVFRAPNIKIAHLFVDLSATGESVCFYFDIQKNQPVTQEEVKDIITEGAYHVVADSRMDKRIHKVYITNTVIDGLVCRNNRQTALRTKNFWGFIFFRNILLDNSALTVTDGNYAAMELEDNEGAVLQNIHIIGTGNPKNDCEVGFLYTCNVATWMDNCSAEKVGSDGLRIQNGGFHLYFSNVSFKKVGGHGMLLADCLYPQLHNVYAEPDDAAFEESCGIFGNNLIDAQLNDISAKNCKKAGVYMENSHHNIVTGLHVEATPTPYYEGEKCGLNIALFS